MGAQLDYGNSRPNATFFMNEIVWFYLILLFKIHQKLVMTRSIQINWIGATFKRVWYTLVWTE